MDVLEKLRKGVFRVQKAIVATRVLHHDNDPSHTAFRVCEFLTKHNLTTLPQPPRIKIALKGHRSESNKAIQALLMTALNEVPVEVFEAAYRTLENLQSKSVDAWVVYFEDF